MAIALLVAGPALAADDDTGEDLVAEQVFDTVIYWSGDFNYSRSNRYGYGADAGFVTALNGDIGTSGWTFTGNIGLSRSVDPGSSSKSFAGSLLFGYQWNAPDYYVSVAAGGQYINNNETPGGGPTDGDKLGAVFQYVFETNRVDAFYLQSFGAASTAYDQLYFHAKAGYKTATLRFGGEFSAFDDEGSRPTLRYGAFLGDIPLGENVSMVVSVGYQHELDRSVSDGVYATLGFSAALSTR